MDLILVAGLWLKSDVWDRVVEHLRELGHNPTAVELPGADDGSSEASLDDQLQAVLAAVDKSTRPVVVGHSAACGLAWLAADRRPEAISRIVLIGGMPPSADTSYADFLEPVDGVVPFPGWDKFDGPDSADLDDAAKQRLSAGFVPVPVGVSKGIVRLGDERRYSVPVTLVCPEFSADDAKAWMAAGEIPELAKAHDVSFVDIDTGHWPMVTAPEVLARAIT